MGNARQSQEKPQGARKSQGDSREAGVWDSDPIKLPVNFWSHPLAAHEWISLKQLYTDFEN